MVTGSSIQETLVDDIALAMRAHKGLADASQDEILTAVQGVLSDGETFVLELIEGQKAGDGIEAHARRRKVMLSELGYDAKWREGFWSEINSIGINPDKLFAHMGMQTPDVDIPHEQDYAAMFFFLVARHEHRQWEPRLIAIYLMAVQSLRQDRIDVLFEPPG